MKTKELVEKLEDLATFFTLAASDAGKAKATAERNERFTNFDYFRGKEEVYKTAFNKIDHILKEVKE